MKRIFVSVVLLFSCASKKIPMGEQEFQKFIVTRFNPGPSFNLLDGSSPAVEDWKLSPASKNRKWSSTWSKFKPLADSADWKSLKRLELPRHLIPYTRYVFPEDYNTYLYFLNSKLGPTRWAIRPVEIDTGCDSQCLPVVFHLLYQKENLDHWKFVQILTETDYPLTKINHEPMTDADIKGLETIIHSSPQRDLLGSDPAWTTDHEILGFGQTWTYLKPFTVPGGAYSSYRILESHQLTHEYFLSQLSTLEGNISQTDKEISALLRAPLLPDTPKNLFRVFWNRRQDTGETRYRKLRLGVATWILANGFENPGYRKLVQEFKWRLSEQCILQNELLRLENGRVYFLGSVSHRDFCPLFHKEILVQILRERPFGSKQLESLLQLGPTVPKYIANNRFLYSRFLNSSTSVSDSIPYYKSWQQDFNLRFPSQATEGSSMESLQRYLKTRFSRYFDNPVSFEPSSLRLSKFIEGGFRATTIGTSKESKVFIFFSSTCIHCLELFQEYRNSKLYREYSSRTHWIHIGRSLEDTTWTSDFCSRTKWPLKDCQNNFYQMNSTTTQSKRFFLNSQFKGTPFILFVDASGKQLFREFPLEIYSQNKDSERPLLLDLHDLLKSF
jgi:hypothetical protein